MDIQIQAGIDPNAILREVSRIAALPALAELIDNAFDAGSLNCNIFTDHQRRPTRVVIIDTGTGMNNDGLTAFFNYGKSEWLTKRHKGRNGKGSKYMFYHAKEVSVVTKVSGEEQCKQFTVTLDYWLNKILTRQTVAVKSVPAGSHSNEPKNESFTVFDVTPHENKRQFFSEDNLLDNLAGHLSPQFVDRVFVNGKAIKPLENLSGFTFESTDPTLGDIRAYIYHPEKIRYREGMRIDDLRIGTIGPVMEFQGFVKGLPPALRQRIPACFHAVCGLIEVEGFNEWREGASREFRDELYLSSSAEVFISFLENVLGPQISKEFGFTNATIDDRAKKSFQSLRELTEKRWGRITDDQLVPEKPTRPRGLSAFSISPFSIEMIPGEKQIFTVTRTPEGATFEWDASEIPGAKLDKTTGTSVELSIDPSVAYHPDQYQLTCKLLPTGLFRRAHIKLAPYKELAIVPRSGSYYVDDKIYFKAVNVPAGCQTLSWSVEPKSAGVFMKNSGLNNLAFACKEPGKCVILAANPTNLLMKVQTELYIHAKELVKKKAEPTEDVIRIEDTVFIIQMLSDGRPLQAFREEKGPGRVILHINVHHPRYVETLQSGESVFLEYLIHLAISQYLSLLAQKREMADTEKEELTGRLLAEMI
ncbi:ATP-binding protein [Candidatus Falkowbacteria bacterium]|nr:ATP-binding protein [Candidatus Falkowbacteria bacterium]